MAGDARQANQAKPMLRWFVATVFVLMTPEERRELPADLGLINEEAEYRLGLDEFQPIPDTIVLGPADGGDHWEIKFTDERGWDLTIKLPPRQLAEMDSEFTGLDHVFADYLSKIEE